MKNAMVVEVGRKIYGKNTFNCTSCVLSDAWIRDLSQIFEWEITSPFCKKYVTSEGAVSQNVLCNQQLVSKTVFMPIIILSNYH